MDRYELEVYGDIYVVTANLSNASAQISIDGELSIFQTADARHSKIEMGKLLARHLYPGDEDADDNWTISDLPSLACYPDEDHIFEYENAKDFYSDLAYHVGDLKHPICDPQDLDDFEPETDAEHQLLEYAQEAWRDAQRLESHFKDAIEAWQDGDFDSVLLSLDRAKWLEKEYGDDPATRTLRKQLISA